MLSVVLLCKPSMGQEETPESAVDEPLNDVKWNDKEGYNGRARSPPRNNRKAVMNLVLVSSICVGAVMATAGIALVITRRQKCSSAPSPPTEKEHVKISVVPYKQQHDLLETDSEDERGFQLSWIDSEGRSSSLCNDQTTIAHPM